MKKALQAKMYTALVGVLTTHNTLAVVIPTDYKLHTDSHPFCNDLICPCHETIDTATGKVTDYYQEYIRAPYQAGLLSRQEKERIFHGDHL